MLFPLLVQLISTKLDEMSPTVFLYTVTGLLGCRVQSEQRKKGFKHRKASASTVLLCCGAQSEQQKTQAANASFPANRRAMEARTQWKYQNCVSSFWTQMYPIFEIQNTNASQFWKSKNTFSTAVRTAELDYSDFKHLCLRIPARVFPTIFVSPTLVRRGGSVTILQNVGWKIFGTHLCRSQSIQIASSTLFLFAFKDIPPCLHLQWHCSVKTCKYSL